MYSALIEQRSSANGGEARKRNAPNDEPNDEKKMRINNINATHRRIRILSRRYTLTKTDYKFLDIGIVVDSPSYADIVLGDCHGKEISFSPETWQRLVEQKNVVLSNLQSVNNDATPISVGNVTLRFGKINNLSVLRVETPTIRLVLSLSTVRVLFDHDCCVKRIVASLNAVTKNVDATLSRFLEIAKGTTNPEDVPRAIRDSENFDRGNIVNCEIAVLCFGM